MNNMPKKFYPIDFIMVDPSQESSKSTTTQPAHAQYKVSIGHEDWDEGNFPFVYKIQMVYDGKISGRRSPSYPVGTDDFENITKAIEKLKQKHAN